MSAVKAVLRSPVSLITGIGLFSFGLFHFSKLAIIPRLPGGGGA